ncbi:MAG: hypothetical protein LBT14_05170 [Treponema sp.]|jgi:hypothetical protein|nr:hypothetical protein [Treponema sp.]
MLCGTSVIPAPVKAVADVGLGDAVFESGGLEDDVFVHRDSITEARKITSLFVYIAGSPENYREIRSCASILLILLYAGTLVLLNGAMYAVTSYTESPHIFAFLSATFGFLLLVFHLIIFYFYVKRLTASVAQRAEAEATSVATAETAKKPAVWSMHLSGKTLNVGLKDRQMYLGYAPVVGSMSLLVDFIKSYEIRLLSKKTLRL